MIGEEEEILQDGAEGIEDAGEGEPAAGAEVTEPAGAKKPDAAIDYAAEYKRSQKELKAERSRLKEANDTAQYWAEQARNSKPAKAPEPEPEDDLSDVDLVNELTSNGVKGLDGLLGRMGYAKRRDVDATIAATRSEITSQADLMRDYPDLGDKDSEFFKHTAKIYNSLTADDPRMNKSKAIVISARMAKAELAATNGGQRSRRGADPDLEDGEGEYEEDPRDARIARQSGDRGRRDVRRAAPTISAAEKAMVENFRRAGADIDEERYLKTALKGVAIGGIPANHRGR